ncbi:MAG TPA: RNA polymerase sigma factor [Solirubrobacteraceae bacterium]|jgi:RNA polymerase sigma-70 factor (ECF subfamily)|nr:RNA polymerase sigma factor [Solirubrobacteraceae bacterium]
MSELTDLQLLVAAKRDPEAFVGIYRRYERPVLAFFLRAVRVPELAADLTAEVFAQALVALDRFDPALGEPDAWLFGIARNLLSRSRARGRVEIRARAALGMGPLALDDEAFARIEQETGQVLELLGQLPDATRAAVFARVVDERDYEAIAAELRCSELVVRKRVSRGLATIKAQLEARR